MQLGDYVQGAFIMYLERVSANKIKVLIPFDEIEEHGLQNDESNYDLFKWEPIFHEMIAKVNEEFNLLIEDTVVIDIYSLHQQGIVFILTFSEDEIEQYQQDEFINFGMFYQQNNKQLFQFIDIEDLIQCSAHIYPFYKNGSVYYFKNHYYLFINPQQVSNYERIKMIITEYADYSSLTHEYLQEYGTNIFNDSAIQKIYDYFLT